MKVGFVLDDSLDAPGGVQQYVLTLGQWLNGQGHEVHYLAGQTTRRDIDNVHSLSRNTKVRFNKNQLSIPLPVAKQKLQKFLSAQRYDVLHVQLPYSPQFAARVITAAPVKTAIIGTFHILPYGRLQKTGASLLGTLTRSSLNRFNHIVAVSPAAQVFAKEVMKIDSTVVPNAVDLSRFAPGRKEETKKKTIAFLGRLVPRKGALELLKAIQWMQAHNKLHNVQVLIGGSGQDQARLERYITRNKLTSYVRMVGQLSESDKPNFLASADVVALPSVSGESFGIILVEAIASGAGVTVGGNNPGYQFVLSDTPETLIDPRSTEDFGRLLDRLLTDTSFRSKLGLQQRQHIRQFDVSVVGKEIESIYKDATAKHAKV